MSLIKQRALNFTRMKIFWPVLALTAILLFNFIFVPGFFSNRNKRRSPVRQLDRRPEPGGADADYRHRYDARHRQGGHRYFGRLRTRDCRGGLHFAAGVDTALGSHSCGACRRDPVRTLERHARVGVRHSADGRHAHSHDGRPGHRPADHGRAGADHKQRGVRVYRQRLSVRSSVLCLCSRSRVRSRLCVEKKRTALGLFLEATGTNKISSEYAGVEPRKIYLFVYAVCGLCAAIAGLLVSSNISSADANNAGLWIELDAILAVVIGGTSMRGGRFYLAGTVVGALFIQSLSTTIYSMGIPPERILVVKAFVVIVVSLLQSERFRELFQSRTKQAVAES